MTVPSWIALGFIAAAAAVFPFSFWIAGWWGLVALALLLIGCTFLTAALRGRRIDPDGVDQHLEVTPGHLRGELRGFPGARVFNRDDPPDADA